MKASLLYGIYKLCLFLAFTSIIVGVLFILRYNEIKNEQYIIFSIGSFILSLFMISFSYYAHEAFIKIEFDFEKKRKKKHEK